MSTQLIFITISIIALLIIVKLMFYTGKDIANKKLSPLAGLAFAFILAGIVFGENRLVGYGLIGAGVVLALIDIFRKTKND